MYMCTYVWSARLIDASGVVLFINGRTNQHYGSGGVVVSGRGAPSSRQLTLQLNGVIYI